METNPKFSPHRYCMPRLLPRLIKEIEKHSGQVQNFPLKRDKKRRKSLYRPPLPSPSFHPSHHEQSILLADQSPVANAKAYARHKRLPPIMTRPRQTTGEAEDTQRQMTEKEFGWWSNPYRTSALFCILYYKFNSNLVRMLSSTMRTCVVTNRTVPTGLGCLGSKSAELTNTST